MFLLGCVLVTPLYLIYKPPTFLVRYFERRWPDVLWRVDTSEKVVALTIDDGPSEHTKELLEILRANDAAATFFIIGSHALGRQSILQDIIRNGCELGNHAMRDEPSKSLDSTTLTEQIHQVEDMLQDAYSEAKAAWPAKYFRPGSGFFSTKMRELVRRLDYKLVLGNIYPHDPQVPYSNVNARHVLSMLQPGGIIICHDGRSWTAPMLRKILPEIKRKGYRVVTVTSLLEAAQS